MSRKGVALWYAVASIYYVVINMLWLTFLTSTQAYVGSNRFGKNKHKLSQLVQYTQLEKHIHASFKVISVSISTGQPFNVVCVIE